MISFTNFKGSTLRHINNLPAVSTDTGWKLGGTAATVSVGGVPWATPSNVLTDDANAAVIAGSTFDYSDILRVTNFAFGIPGGATINGIEMKYRRRNTTNNDIKELETKLVLSGTKVGNNKADGATFWNSVNETITVGGASDLWGWGSATVANINNSAFGISLESEDSGSGSDTWRIEAVFMKIYYTI